MTIRYGHIIITSTIFSLFFVTVYSQLPQDQKNIMVSLYDLIQNNTGSSFAWNGTNRGSDPCSWKGVSCSPNNSSIISITLHTFSISNPDTLPLLCGITSLESLDVSNNQLSSIPGGFFTGCGGISGLKVLNFSSNRLNGPLPRFNGFGVLESLDMSVNSLSGNIDLQLDGLGSLKNLDLSSNHFSGPLPTNLGKSNALVELQLSDNMFQGEIPSQIVKFENLSLIDLSRNSLSGSIPQGLGDLSRLNTLILSANNLSGTIPKTLGNITTLSRFAANQNGFVGNVPPGITRYLNNLDLSYNSLNGTIPLDLLSPSNLQYVDLSNNFLEGPIPANMGSTLIRLRLGSNKLSGPIPTIPFQSLQNLTYLELENNQLNGSIPLELFLCKKLALLNLGQNKLTGSLPVEMGNLIDLQVLKLEMNHFFGGIPDSISKLHNLQRLNMSWNSLTGIIPESVSTMQFLTNLDLRQNGLNGSIPKSIGSLNLLLELQLGKNQLSGLIPDMPIQLQIALNLSHNLFSGPIPTSLSRLASLEVLDLSNNRFSGQIPSSMTGMSGLTRLLLTNNQLSGVVPDFPKYVELDIINGNHLIIPPPPPPQNSPPLSSKKKLSVGVVVVIAVAVAAVGSGLIICIALSISRRYDRVEDISREDISQPQVINGNLLTANGIHRSSIDFKKAMEAVAEPSNIILKTRLSTYYKAVMPSGGTYFVKRLNWSDKIFQLGNHKRFGEELESLGKLSNSNVMIPLAYVLAADNAYLFYDFAPAGTLHDVLHVSTENTLDWASRYSIAIGVAQGLAFLHSSHILLLDLSSKSVMLKSLNEPQLGDIELCKLIDPSKSTGNLSTVAGSVGYIPPEYAYTMRVTVAGNVYSFGVVLLELLTGKPAVSQGTELAKWVLSNSAQENKWDHILDFGVSKKSLAVRSQMLSVMKVALACVSVLPEGRPKMKSVLRMLLNAR